jgi:hypothetical protein
MTNGCGPGSTIEASESNRLQAEDGSLAVISERVTPRRRFEGGPRRFVNAIDVTDMRIDGKPFDLQRLRREKSGFDVEGLRQKTR